MSNEKRRPQFRLTAKDKHSKEFTELGVAWPENENAPGCHQFTLSKEMTPKKVAEILSEGGKEGRYFIDLRVNTPRETAREDF